MVARTVECPVHGKQGIGIACIHVALAIDSGAQVGFFWSEDDQMARGFAWCGNCESRLLDNDGDFTKIKETAQFKILCAGCWDEAKRRLYDSRQQE